MMDAIENQRVRWWKRDNKGKPYLNDIEIEAEKLGLSLKEAVDVILQQVVKKKLTRDLLSKTTARGLNT